MNVKERIFMSVLICYCKEITKETIQLAIQNGADTLEKIKEITGACTGNDCKSKNPSGKCCSGEIMKLIGGNEIGKTKCPCCN